MCLALAMLSTMSTFALQGEDKPTAPAKFVIVEGQVTDPIGAGQQNVTITVRWKTPDGGKGDVIAATTTDAMGDFAVTSTELIKGDVWVTMSKRQFADLVREVRVGESETPPFLGEVLEGNLALSGRVIDFLTEKPVVAATVVLHTHGPDRKERTDDQGRFRLSGVAPGDAELVIEVDAYGRERRKFSILEDSFELIVALKPERIIHLTVVDDLDRPIRGVTVECADQPRGDFRTTMTDESGSTTLKGIHFDAFMLGVRLTHREFVSDRGFERTITTPSKDRESKHRFVMARAGRITGRVTAAKTDQPIHGARLITGDEYGDDTPRDWTDDQGRFEILGVAPGAIAVSVHLHDYAPELKVAEVQAGEATTLDFQLHPGAVLEGVVKLEGGGLATAAEVAAGRWRSKNTLGLRAMTDATGRFRMEDAPLDDFEIGVTGPGGVMVKKTVRALPGEVVELVVPRTTSTSGGRGNKSFLAVGDPAPMLTLTTLGGESLNFTDLKGKTVLVDFWATWCPPCLDEMPYLIAVYEKYATRKDLVMIGISRDHELAPVVDYLKDNPKIAWPQVFGEKGGVSKACDAFGVSSFPDLFIIGPDGKVVDAHLRGPQLTARVDALMKDRPPG